MHESMKARLHDSLTARLLDCTIIRLHECMIARMHDCMIAHNSILLSFYRSFLLSCCHYILIPLLFERILINCLLLICSLLCFFFFSWNLRFGTWNLGLLNIMSTLWTDTNNYNYYNLTTAKYASHFTW